MIKEIKFDFNDILIKPEVLTSIESRSEINPYDENDMLPIFASPMDTVVDEISAYKFIENKIYAIEPRKKDYKRKISYNKLYWVSLSLQETIDYYINESHSVLSELYQYSRNRDQKDSKMYLLIDCAHGGLMKLFDACRKLKDIYKDTLVLMIGNIANPETYEKYCDIEVDYVRCSIGSGEGCTTSANGAVGYPVASLISECREIADKHKTPAKIVADGGFKTYADIIKGLALGADYVMLGGMLNRCLESCSPCLKEYDGYEEIITDSSINRVKVTYKEEITYKKALECFNNGIKIYKNYRGMSTKAVQASLGCKVLKTAEGIEKVNEVKYTISSWSENFHDYLRSNMSYCGKRHLHNYIGNVDYVFVSQHAFNRFNK